MDRKLKHLEFIQATINRLSTNSFLLKGWSVVLVSALIILSGEKSNDSFAYLAFVPIVIIWGLDGFFLWQERLYRKLYNKARTKEDTEVDFSMSTKEVSDGFIGLLAATFSKTLIPFHGSIVGAILVVGYLVR